MVFYCERELEIEQKLQYSDPYSYGRQRCLSRSPDAQPEPWGPLCWALAFFTASYQHLLWTPIHQGHRPLRLGVAFPTTSPLQLSATQLARRTQLSYIIVRRPLYLWNRMFNRHQAEITVMQFRGHSLPVHQSMSVPWEFFSLSHFISQFPPTRFSLITAIRMCHLRPVHHLGMPFLAGSKGQNTTMELTVIHILILTALQPVEWLFYH